MVSLFTGINNPVQWGPYTDRGRILTQSLLCSPCHRPGCDVMACIRETRPEAVIRAFGELLPA